jgi:eukaryotic-like serine/threonine-protein kinase
MSIDVGEIIHGKYKLMRLLGRGGMGEVWVARHVSLGEEVAIKFLLEPEGTRAAEREGGEKARRRFLFEAQVAARLSRKTRHVVSVVDHGEHDGAVYLAMELLEGETLEALLGRAGRRPLAEVEAIVGQIVRALAVAHADGVFHRDLKPANIFLGKDEHGGLLVKLLDFGIARRVSPLPGAPRAPRTTERGVVLGTPSYMSPEQVQGLAKLDHRCDLWALAVVAYEMLGGVLPFPGDAPEPIIARVMIGHFEPVTAARPELPASLDGFFGRAFAADDAARFATAVALGDSFARAAAGEWDVAAKPVAGSTRRTLSWSAAALLPLAVAATFAVVARHPSATGRAEPPASPAVTAPPVPPSAPVPPPTLSPPDEMSRPDELTVRAALPLSTERPKSVLPPRATVVPAAPAAPGSSAARTPTVPPVPDRDEVF